MLKQSALVAMPLLLVAVPDISMADTATCEIKIRDIRKGNTYRLERAFIFRKGEEKVQRMHFDTPGNDYSCTLVFVELKKGTMLSCEDKRDLGTTFFQSDRTLLNDPVVLNNLSFGNKATFLVIETKCE